MHIPLNWLSDYIDIDLSVEELCQKLTMLGLEIEAVESPGDAIQELYVGKILSIDKHPDADKLVVCKTDIGKDEPLQIVCGAKNMKPGDKVAAVIVGGLLPGDFKIARRKMRGVESQGMMCSAKELGLGEDHDGLLILDAEAPIGADAKGVLGLDEVTLEIEITPNRGDWAAMIGVARDLAAALGTTYQRPEIELTESGEEASTLASVDIQAPDLCHRYVGRVVTDVKVGPSPQWLVQRLVAAGQRSINNVVDITNYVMLETGQPLHAFDLDKLHENRIVVRNASPGEKIETLDNETHTLTPEMLVIADAHKAVAVAGCMGGADSEVGESATRILIESACFDPISVRKTARALNLATESAQRFQRGVDPETTLYAANRATMLLEQLAGGKVAAGTIDNHPTPASMPQISLRYERARAVLGTPVPDEKQKSILVGLGFAVIEESAEGITVQVPSWRHDCSLEADLIEEIVRLHGYDQIVGALPRVRRREEPYTQNYEVVEGLRGHLANIGLTEVIHWTFSAEHDVTNAQLPEQAANMLPLANPLSENHATMRSSLVPSLLRCVSSNLRKTRQSIHLFELGPVYAPLEDSELPNESQRIAIALSGSADTQHWSRPQQDVNFADIRGYAEDILDLFQASDAQFTAHDGALYQPGIAGEIQFRQQTIGTLGQVNKKVLANFEIEHPVFLLELYLEPLLKVCRKTTKFEAIPAFPPSLRDLAVVVDSAFPAGELLEIARKSGGKNLKAANLFDIYTGDQVPDGKKSVAINLAFQSNERTLTDKDTQKAVDKIIKNMTKTAAAELR